MLNQETQLRRTTKTQRSGKGICKKTEDRNQEPPKKDRKGWMEKEVLNEMLLRLFFA